MTALNTKKVIPQLLGQIANVGLQEELTVTAEKIKWYIKNSEGQRKKYIYKDRRVKKGRCSKAGRKKEGRNGEEACSK